MAKGIAILGELYAETRNPTFVFNQGRCYQKNSQLEQARGAFAEYLRIGTGEPPPSVERARGFIKEIDETLARQRANAPKPVLVVPVQSRQGGDEGHGPALRRASIVLAAVAVVGLGAGVYLSFKVKSVNDSVNQQFANQPYVTDEARLDQQISDGKSYETWQWVGYGLGVAALAAAVTVAPTASSEGVGGVVRMRF